MISFSTLEIWFSVTNFLSLMDKKLLLLMYLLNKENTEINFLKSRLFMQYVSLKYNKHFDVYGPHVQSKSFETAWNAKWQSNDL